MCSVSRNGYAVLLLMLMIADCQPKGPYTSGESLVAVPTEGRPCQVGCGRQSSLCISACGPMADDCYEYCRASHKECDLRCPGAIALSTPDVPLAPRPTARRDMGYPTPPAAVPTASLQRGPLSEDLLRP